MFQQPPQDSLSALVIAMRYTGSWLENFFDQLTQRGVVRAAAVYAAVAFVLLQGADLLFRGLAVPDTVFRLLAVVTVVGFPVILVLAWLFDMSGGRLRRADADVAGAATASASTARLQMLSVLVVAGLVVAGGVVLLLGVRWRADDDPRIGIAVFPFRPSGPDVQHWAEGAADLLSTLLDGTEGIRVADPWSLWSGLRSRDDELSAVPPEPSRAATLARAAGASRFLLGAAVSSGTRVDVSARFYDARRNRPLETFTVSGTADDLAGVVRRLAVQVIARVWGDTVGPMRLLTERNATDSPEALKAYLAARAALRRGWVDSASAAIDQAIALDSTFALALADAVVIQSWAQSMRGEPFTGLTALVERAMRHADRLSTRGQLRLRAMEASVRTDGPAAADALHQILERDPTDLDAWTLLAYVRTVYGWQYGVAEDAVVAALERVLALDSTHVPGLAARAWVAVALEEADATVARMAHLLEQAQPSPLGRGTLNGIRVLTTPDSAFTGLADSLATTTGDWLRPYFYLRSQRPARAALLLERVQAAHAGTNRAVTASAELARLQVAMGRTAAVEAGLGSGVSARTLLPGLVNRVLVAARLTGVAEPAAADRAAAALALLVPPDSALAYFETRPVWLTGWLVGAYHAQYGDSSIARRWQAALGTLPPGGTSWDYRASLQADIEARLAARRDRLEAALDHARTALYLWAVHTENQAEFNPEPSMRFHLAMLHKAHGGADSAEVLLRSLVPPTSWFGFLTARASFELGALAEARNDRAAAARHYRRAQWLWALGDTEIAPWRQQTEAALQRLATPR